MDSQHNRGQLEVDQEYDDAEVNQSMRSGDPVGFLVQNEDHGCDQGCLGVAVGKKSVFFNNVNVK